MADTKLSFTFNSDDMAILARLKRKLGAEHGKQSHIAVIRKALRALLRQIDEKGAKP